MINLLIKLWLVCRQITKKQQLYNNIKKYLQNPFLRSLATSVQTTNIFIIKKLLAKFVAFELAT